MAKFYLTKNSSQTKKLAEVLAKKILKTKPKRSALILNLVGALGSGKTTFLQGFAKGLGIKEKILSPTFIIMRKFKIPSKYLLDSLKFENFYHFDCYRIKKPKEILDLGFKEIISNPQNIVVIEWADRIKKIIPKKAIWINFCFFDSNIRKITFKIE